MIKKKYSQKLKRNVWGFDAYIGDGAAKKRVRIYEFETRDEAGEALAALKRSEREIRFGLAPLINRPTLHDLIDKRIPLIARREEKTRARRILYTWLSLLDPRIRLEKKYQPAAGHRSPIKVDEIKTASVRVYVEKRQADGRTSASINRELATIAATLNQAGEIFSELEQWRPPKMPRLKAIKSRRERLISDDEYRQIVAYLRRPMDELDGLPANRPNAYKCRTRVAQIFEFAMLTGARHGEIVGLKWMDISWERGKVLVYQGKTDAYKEIPLTSSLIALLNERKPPAGIYVFTKGGKIFLTFYKCLRAACEHLGIPYGRWDENGLVLHSARHTITTHLIEAGLDYDTIGSITGHKAKELIAHYGHKHPGSVARAAAVLENLGKNLGKNGDGHGE